MALARTPLHRHSVLSWAAQVHNIIIINTLCASALEFVHVDWTAGGADPRMLECISYLLGFDTRAGGAGGGVPIDDPPHVPPSYHMMQRMRTTSTFQLPSRRQRRRPQLRPHRRPALPRVRQARMRTRTRMCPWTRRRRKKRLRARSVLSVKILLNAAQPLTTARHCRRPARRRASAATRRTRTVTSTPLSLRMM